MTSALNDQQKERWRLTVTGSEDRGTPWTFKALLHLHSEGIRSGSAELERAGRCGSPDVGEGERNPADETVGGDDGGEPGNWRGTLQLIYGTVSLPKG